MGTMWRPALRCDSSFRDYIDSLHKVTSLDKNQIMRLMMFVAAHTNEFKEILAEYKSDGVTSLPCPSWRSWEDALWLNQTYKQKRHDTIAEKLDNTKITLKSNGGVIKLQL